MYQKEDVMIVYVLRLQDGKFFVGSVQQNAEDEPHAITYEYVMETCQNEMQGLKWLQNYPPIEIQEVRIGCRPYDDVKCMLRCMDHYGVENVRSSILPSMELVGAEMELLRRLVYTPLGKCAMCGASDHFVKNCNYAKWNELCRTCFICQNSGHSTDTCPLRAPSTTPKLDSYAMTYTMTPSSSSSPNEDAPSSPRRSFASMIFDKIYDWIFDPSRQSEPTCCTKDQEPIYEPENDEYIFERYTKDNVDDDVAMVDSKDYVCTEYEYE